MQLAHTIETLADEASLAASSELQPVARLAYNCPTTSARGVAIMKTLKRSS